MKFTELKLRENLQKSIDEIGFVECTDVQERTFIHTLNGKDVAVQSQTGTGKTAAFLITIFERMLERSTRALVIAPTRELAQQIEKEAKLLGQYLDITIGCIYGGVGYRTQERLLRDDADVVIGTPGRLIDFINQKKLDLKKFDTLVIDEADRLLDMGFLPDLRRIIRALPPCTKRQTMLFSATLTRNARLLAADYMNHPVEVEVTPEQVTVEAITQELYHVGQVEKMQLLLGVLDRDKPANGLIFVNRKHVAKKIAKRLEINGYNCGFLNGDLSQSIRNRTIEDFKTGKIPFLVATDVAARGLHVDDLELVVNYDLPQDVENYVHRIGRTARAGKTGKAISLACETYVYSLEGIQKYIGIKIPVFFADDTLFLKDLSEGLSLSSRKRPATPVKSSRSRPSKPIPAPPPAEKMTPIAEETADKPKKKRRRRRRKKPIPESIPIPVAPPSEEPVPLPKQSFVKRIFNFFQRHK